MLQSNATIISDRVRAVRLFPPIKCAQCQGSTTIQRYRTIPCPDCGGEGRKNGEPCPGCLMDRAADKGSGERKVPEKIPCPGCASSGERRRVPDVRPASIAALKLGDWVQIGVEFPAITVKDVPAGQKFENASSELISCIVTGVPQNSNSFAAKVMQTPTYAEGHGLRYGDILQLNRNQILTHATISEEDFEKSRDAGLLNSTVLALVAPVASQSYICRGGRIADIFDKVVDQTGEYFLGRADGERAEWHTDGAGRHNRRDLDLVSLKAVVNV